MKLAYFPKYCALNSAQPMTAFLHSCRRHGIELAENSMTADAAVIWSVTWAGRMQPNQEIYRHYRQHNRPVIIVEVGALHRGHTWKIAVNNITADGFYGHLENLDWTRPTKLNIGQSNAVATKPSVLVVAQNNQSLQVQSLASVDQWIVDTANTLRSYTDRAIVVRPHPRSRINTARLPHDVTVEIPQKLVNSYDSFDIDYHHHAVINYNSGAGVQAAIAGSTVVVDRSSLASPVSIDIQNIENFKNTDRSQWLVQIAHTEYLIEEIERGLWLPRLMPMLPL
jgi:hypothetical protein